MTYSGKTKKIALAFKINSEAFCKFVSFGHFCEELVLVFCKYFSRSPY